MRRTFVSLALGSLAALGVFAACGSDGSNASGGEGEACYGNGTCNAGLTCLSHLCVNANSDAASEGDANANANADAAAAQGDGAASGDDGGVSDAGQDSVACDAGGPPLVVFLNRGGGSYAPGTDDSRTNHASILSATTTILAWTIDDPSWNTVVACVEGKFSPFNVTVTDVDPGTAPHDEVVFVPNAQMPLSGQADFGPFQCAGVPNAVTFANHDLGDLTLECAAAVASIGHAHGVEPVTTCPNAMAFDYSACADAGFTDAALPCGTNTAAACQCGGGTTEDTLARLLAVTGPACR